MPNNVAFRAAIWSQEGRPGEGAKYVLHGMAHYPAKYAPGERARDVRTRPAHAVTTQHYANALLLRRLLRTWNWRVHLAVLQRRAEAPRRAALLAWRLRQAQRLAAARTLNDSKEMW